MGTNKNPSPAADGIRIRRIDRSEREAALALVLRVFLEYEAPDYSAEGVATFQHSVIQNEAYLNALTVYGAWEAGKLSGVLATRKNGAHIALLFVDGARQGRGIGRALFERAWADCPAEEMTVHSSPYAVGIYRQLGFVAIAPEQTEDGIRYTPMACRKKTIG